MINQLFLITNKIYKVQQFKYISNINLQREHLLNFKMHLKPNPDDNGVITKQFLKKLCRSDFKQYYSTASLNDIIYLHYKGFQKIDNLEEFTGLKVIYLEGNAIKKIQNLQKLVNLRCLYLQQNLIRQINGLQTLINLVNLNLSDNLIQRISGLENLVQLSTFQIKRNRIGADGLSDLIGLLQCQTISALDLSDNKIQNEGIIPQILEKMTNLSVVYLQNNEFNKKVPHYRKTLITKIPTLKYIDDKPVFEDQKRFANAWARGGLEEERKQRILYKQQEEQQQIKQHEEFKAMIQRYKQENKKRKDQSEQSSDNHSESQQQSLQTYNTPTQSKEGSERASQIRSQSDSQTQQNLLENAVQTENQKQSIMQPEVTTFKQKQLSKEENIKNQQELQKDTSKYLDEID